MKLFDKFGRIKPELVDNVHKRGTGVWGRDLEEGKLLYITDVNVLARVSAPCPTVSPEG